MTSHRQPTSAPRSTGVFPAHIAVGLILLATGAAGQAGLDDPLRFRHLTIADGLSQNAVKAVLQDRRGFMWFGTKDGLNRFDGYDFVVFRTEPFDSTTVSDSDITALYEDGRGGLWVGTRNGGLNAFDRATKTFRRFPDGPAQPITALAGDGEGGLWIGTDGAGLFRYRPETGTFDHWVHEPDRPGSLSDDRVKAVLVDRRGAVWVGTERGLNRLDPSEPAGAFGGASEGSPVSFVRYGVQPGDSLGTIDMPATALYEDGQGRLWVGSIPGVSVFSPDRSTVRHYFHRYREYRYGWGLARDLLVDRTGRVWLSTVGELMLLDPSTGVFRYLRHDPLEPSGINSDQPTVLYQDRAEVIWVGTNGSGLNLYDPKATRFRTFVRPEPAASRLSQFSVYSLFEDSADRVWIGAGVLYRWDRRSGEFSSFETTSDRPDDFGNHAVWSIVEEPEGFLWVASVRGLYHYEIATGRARHYRHDNGNPDGLPEPDVRKVFRARDGTIWAITENYLARLADAGSGRFVSYRFTERITRSDWTFPAVFEDARGDLWLGTHQGLARFRPSSESFRHFRSDGRNPAGLSHDIVRSLLADPRRPETFLWIGTAGGGLDRLDLEAGTFDHFTVADGLPNNVVYGILPDDRGHLWLSTNRGLTRFDPEGLEFRSYDAADGLQSNEFNSGAYFRSDDGELFFGGIYGFNYFRPDQVHDNPYPPEIALTAFRRGNRYETVRDSGSVLTAAISELDRLEVRHEDNVVSFEFAALDYSAPEKNRYAYRLLDFNREWVDAGTDRTATYTHLPPGSYTFQVRGSNNDGVWNQAGASLILTVVPPWWRTPWAYAGYALLTLGLLLGIRRYELGRAQLRNRLEIERVAAEKLRELDRAKSRFFADVSHEFRTPLTLTLGPLDDLLEGGHGSLGDAARDQIRLARRSAHRVLDLINQIMELARLEAGSTPLKTRRLDLIDFVGEATGPYHALAERRTIRLDLALPPGPVPVDADPEQLGKVMDNLLSNALKFTPEGGTVRVTVEAGAETVRIGVRDSGPGIPVNEQARVFDRFYRVERTAAPQSGTGIGLALAKELVELHGGKLWVDSEEGFGSTFTFELGRPPAEPPRSVLPSEPAPELRSRD